MNTNMSKTQYNQKTDEQVNLVHHSGRGDCDASEIYSV